MSTLFSRIIAGELPGRFVWSDERAVAMLTIAPITAGHALVVPREEVDHWLDADDALLEHLVLVAKQVGVAQRAAYAAPRVGLMIAGLEVPHLHVHVWPVSELSDFGFDRVDHDPDPRRLDDDAARIRDALTAGGHRDRVPADVSRLD